MVSDPLSVFEEAKDSTNVVLGAMLGAYLGLTVSSQKVSGSGYFSLAVLLVGCCFFVTAIVAAGRRMHNGENWKAPIYLALSIAPAWMAIWSAGNLKINQGILATILGVWLLLIATEILSMMSANYFGKKITRD